MNFELYVALRYLLARRKQAFISVISLISVLGVALGVAALIIVLGVMTGFSTDLRDKILGVNAHLFVLSTAGGISDYQDLVLRASEVDGVVGAAPFIYSEVMLSTPQGVKGVALRGIDPDAAPEVIDLEKDMFAGKVSDLSGQGNFPGIIVGQDLAARLGLMKGARVNVLAPAAKRTSAGFMPTVRIFEVAGIFKTGMYEYDSSLAYVTIPAAQDLLGYKTDLISGLELKVTDIYAAGEIGDRVLEVVGGPPYYTMDWMDMNANLFAALKLEKTAMFIILIMIVLVGSFSIVTTLIMLVMEKTKDIAILMSMGATPGTIGRIFIYQGTIIGVLGTGLGYAVGITASLLLKKYQFIKLPSDVYLLDHLPVRLEVLDMAAIGVAAVFLCFLATLYPARQASKLQPAEALGYE